MARLLEILSIFVLLVLRPATAAAPSCSTVTAKLTSCVSYIDDQSAQPTSDCCAGVKSILAQATSKPDKIATCNCIKSALAIVGNKVDTGRVSSLPKQCGMSVNLPPIDKNYDCSKISWYFP
ncbi:non-specific lipid-transfer -like [Olea europaea subsp. europaea]|uniref:Non-specific lipid-transfer protein n=1 Tax=Olea europaea subsp. europaea TaxID=158383 RepID=A0A8S0T105_OLEEU|nr:non-specific lipid-transfer -like [Olea europaea subsp. europaea]